MRINRRCRMSGPECGKNTGAGDRRTFYAPDAASWRAWLDSYAATEKEVWLEFPKKHTGRPCVPYGEALDEALCRGWIDSVIRRVDDDVYLRKFTPRTNTTNWSAKNLAAVSRLVSQGRMRPEGLAVLGVPLDSAGSLGGATANGEDGHTGAADRDAEGVRGAEVPPFVAEAIGASPEASAFWETLAPGYRKRYLGWIMSAKQEETRKNRLARVIGFLEEGRKSVMV
jgi:uncharacterized protein YdeI (YjbR/CyaY-like superfamily)